MNAAASLYAASARRSTAGVRRSERFAALRCSPSTNDTPNSARIDLYYI